MALHLQIDADPDADPAYHLDADPDADPGYQNDADPCGSGRGSTTLVLRMRSEMRIKTNQNRSRLTQETAQKIYKDTNSRRNKYGTRTAAGRFVANLGAENNLFDISFLKQKLEDITFMLLKKFLENVVLKSLSRCFKKL